jgi:hypothetical protein
LLLNEQELGGYALEFGCASLQAGLGAVKAFECVGLGLLGSFEVFKDALSLLLEFLARLGWLVILLWC